jgi:hypothetical protein
VKVSFPTGISQNKPKGGFSVYPNPTADVVHISGLTGSSEIQITDLTGKQLLKQVVAKSTTIIDMHDFPCGIYFLKSAAGMKKIVKM